MIEFQCTRWDRNNAPVTDNASIQDYAEMLLGDYKPALLQHPERVNGIHFLETYLKLSVDYQYIYYEENELPIAGATVFENDMVRIFDREKMCVRSIPVRANTVLLDNSILVDGKEGFANFTAMHEAGHFCMHSRAYRHEPRPGQNILCCRHATVGQPCDLRGKKLTSRQNLEHQANVFAAYIMMPRQTFLPYARELIRSEGYLHGAITDFNDWETDYRLQRVLRQLAETYGVSCTAAKIHMEELGLIQSQRDPGKTPVSH